MTADEFVIVDRAGEGLPAGLAERRPINTANQRTLVGRGSVM